VDIFAAIYATDTFIVIGYVITYIMASLLGSKYCIESLRGDVSDLQSAVVDVLSRVGRSATFRSWKYPDKASADVNVAELLETHVYSEDEEQRQITHVVLMELVIDRYYSCVCKSV